jgi:type VI secretion system protein ImpA
MDINRLLAAISDEFPSGVELRNDARFHAIERKMEPAARNARLNPDGSVNDAAPDIDWQSVLDDGLALAQDGRDLRLLTILVRAPQVRQQIGVLGGFGLI